MSGIMKKLATLVCAGALVAVSLSPTVVTALADDDGRASGFAAGDIVQVVSGASCTAALKADGSLWTWGDNTCGQLGNGAPCDGFREQWNATPTKVLDDVTYVSTGPSAAHMAALKSDGTLWTWGSDISGELGDGNVQSESSVPVQVARDVASVACGSGSTYVLKTDGSLWTWDWSWEYGSEENPDITFTRILDDVVSVSAGSGFAAALKADASLWTWGNSGFGKLGTGDTSNVGDDSAARSGPTKIMEGVLSVSLGGNHAAALKTDGSLWTWGYNDSGQLGNGGVGVYEGEKCNPTPGKIMDDVVSMSMGGNHSAAIKADGSLWMWGENERDQLGNDDVTTQLFPAKVMDGVSSVSLGFDHTAVLKTDGSLWLWGSNISGQLGNGSAGYKSVPANISNDARRDAWADGGRVTDGAFVAADNSLWMWGCNWEGQIGDGTTKSRRIPVKVLNDVAFASTDLDTVSAAIKTDGSLWMWGTHGYGFFDGSEIEPVLRPRKVMDNVASVSVGDSCCAVVKVDGSLWTWGDGKRSGQLGDGADETRSEPARIMDDVVSVSVSSSGACSAAIKADGSLWTWGDNYNGQLGDGSTDSSLVPIRVLEDVRCVTMTDDMVLAIKTDGSLWTWGSNYGGRLGDGTSDDRFEPVQVMENVASVVLRAGSCAAVKNDGSLWMWGINQYGQLGNGKAGKFTEDGQYDEVVYESMPSKVMDDVASVALGSDGYTTTAVKTDGSLWTWGWNRQGGLGVEGADYLTTHPIKVMDGVAALSGSGQTVLAADGSYWAWGNTVDGGASWRWAVGDGTEWTPFPVRVTLGAPKLPAGLAFSSPSLSRAVSGGAFTAELAKDTDAAVTYSSSNVGVATVDAATGEVTPLRAGTVTITASTPETDDYEAGSASYTLGLTGTLEKFHTATFMVGDDVVDQVRFAEGDSTIAEPALPSRDNYTGSWDWSGIDVATATGDIVVRAVYEPVDPNQVSEVQADAGAEYKDGALTINLRARAATRAVKVVSKKTKPVDVVVVLDQSGSMKETLGSAGQSKRDALAQCAAGFVESLHENALATGAEHRVALVGFAYSNYRSTYDSNRGGYVNTGLLATPSGAVKNYRQLTNADYASALMDVDQDGSVNANVLKGVDAIVADGATAADVGLKMAKNIFAQNPNDGSRERVVVFLTDGTPTSWGEDATLVSQTAASAITEANSIKNGQDARIYSIGVHSDANPGASFTSASNGVTLSGGSFASFDFNRFLHAVSSNYPTASSMAKLGEGSKAGGYYMGVTDTSGLGRIFTSILYSTVYQVAAFDKATLRYTLAPAFTLTLEQELSLKAHLAVMGATLEVTRNEDGSTTLVFGDMPVTESVDADGVKGNEAQVSFEVSGNRASLAGGSLAMGTRDSGVSFGGGEAAAFDVATVEVPSDRRIVVFTVNGTVYRISEVGTGGVVEVPQTELASWDAVTVEGLTGNYSTFEAKGGSAQRYEIHWHIGDSEFAESYAVGEQVSPPDVPQQDGYDFTGWTPQVSATMPAYSFTCTALYSPAHVHKFVEDHHEGSCDTGLVTVFTCSCGAEKRETAEPCDHSYTALLVDGGDKSTTVEKLVCSTCGHSERRDINFKVTATEGRGWFTKTTVLDLNLYKDDVKVQIAEGKTIEMRIYVGDATGKTYRVTRIDSDGKRTSYNATLEDGYLVFAVDHFSVYTIDEGDEGAVGEGEGAGDLSYAECVAELDGVDDAEPVVEDAGGTGGGADNGSGTGTGGSGGTNGGTGQQPQHVHSWAESWSADADGHWHACAGCDERKDSAEHSFGAWKSVSLPTAASAGRDERSCDICGYIEAREVVLLGADAHLEGGSYVYTGAAIEPAVVLATSVKHGSAEPELASVDGGDDMQVSYFDNIDAGQARAVVSSERFLEQPVTLTFTIVPKALDDAGVTSSIAGLKGSYAYTGADIPAASFALAADGRALAVGTDYTVQQSARTCGKVRLTFAGRGNYAGTLVRDTVIVPAKVSGVKLKASKHGKLRVKWSSSAARKARAAGYTITVKRGKKTLKTLTVKGVGKTVATIKLASKYRKKKVSVTVGAYVSVDGAKAYGAPSAAKKAKLK